jgi:hypothetical protein
MKSLAEKHFNEIRNLSLTQNGILIYQLDLDSMMTSLAEQAQSKSLKSILSTKTRKSLRLKSYLNMNTELWKYTSTTI